MNKRLLFLWISALFLLAGTALAACGDDDDDDGGGGGTDTTAAAEIETLEPGTLIVGVDVPYPPFEQGRPPDYEGFEIDMMNEIASRLGLETEYKDTPFDTIFRDLSVDKFDAAIGGATITDEREQAVDFADPWFLTEQSLLVQEDSDIRTIDDLEGKTVGVQKGTTGEAYVQDNANPGDLRSYPEIDDAFNALVAGQVEVVMFDLSGTEEAAEDPGGSRGAGVLQHRRVPRRLLQRGQRRAPRGRQRDHPRDEDGRDRRRGLPEVVRHRAAQGSAREDEHAQVVRRLVRTP